MIPQDYMHQLELRRRRAKHRFALCVIVLLSACAFGVWETDPYNHTTLPSLLTPTPPRSSTPRRPFFLLLENKQSGDFSAIDFYEYTGNPDLLDQAWVLDMRESKGFLLPWHNSIRLQLWYTSATQTPRSDTDRKAIRNAVTDAMSFDRYYYSSRIIRYFRKADGKTVSIDPIYLLIDIAAVVAAALAHITGIKLVQAHREIKRLRQLHAKQCPKCSYDLSGITHQATNCPECGQLLMLTPNTNTSPSERP